MTNYSHYNRTTFGLGLGLGTRVGTRVDRIYQCVCNAGGQGRRKADEKWSLNPALDHSGQILKFGRKKMIYCVRGVTGSGHACDLCCVQGDKRDLIRLTTAVPDAGNSKLQVGFPAYIACFRLLKNGLGACCYQCAAR
jgi:hypothetical protein